MSSTGSERSTKFEFFLDRFDACWLIIFKIEHWARLFTRLKGGLANYEQLR